jgi:uncharacterized protein YcbX
MPAPHVAALNVYPVKSCAGIGQEHVRVAPRGLVASTSSGTVGDREWMIVDRDGTFVTQREYPRLALIGTTLEGGALVFRAPGKAALAVSVEQCRGATRQVVVWRSRVRAHDAGDEAAAWLSSALGAELRLVRFDPSDQRLCNPDFAGDSGAHTAFADGYPLLVVAESSLADLNARLAASGTPALPMNRFRPNIVLAGLDPFAEDHIDTLSIEGVTIKLVKPCARCQITTTDQDSGQVGTEPLATLRGYRMNERLGGVTFGVNAILVAGEGRTVSIGMEVEVAYAF